MTVKPGALRFNTDSMKLEIFRGDSRGEYVNGFGTIGAGQWEEIQVTSPQLLTGGTRVLFGGGYTPSATKTIDFANIETTGNFTDFGDLTDTHNQSKGSTASRTRAVWVGGGEEPSTSKLHLESVYKSHQQVIQHNFLTHYPFQEEVLLAYVMGLVLFLLEEEPQPNKT